MPYWTSGVLVQERLRWEREDDAAVPHGSRGGAGDATSASSLLDAAIPFGKTVWRDGDDGESLWNPVTDKTNQLSTSVVKGLVAECIAAILAVTSPSTRRALQRLVALEASACPSSRAPPRLPIVLWECLTTCGELLFFDRHTILAARRALEIILAATDEGDEEPPVEVWSLQLHSGAGGSVQHYADVRMLFGLVLIRVAALADKSTAEALMEAEVDGYTNDILRSLVVSESELNFMVELFFK
jgi:hypothetical protein